MNRRQFIRAGVVGGAVLAAGGAWMVWRDRDPDERNARAAARQRRIDRIIGAIAPVMLGSALATDRDARAADVERVAADVGHVIAHFTPPVQDEVHQLFALLDIAIARRVLTGVTRDWREAEASEIVTFLERWRRSPLALLQSGYLALHDLVLGAWYASPTTWTAIGYAGPPKVE